MLPVSYVATVADSISVGANIAQNKILKVQLDYSLLCRPFFRAIVLLQAMVKRRLRFIPNACGGGRLNG